MSTRTDVNQIPLPPPIGLGRAQAVRRMFSEVAPRYDLLNHLLSGGLDILWRRRTARLAAPRVDGPVVDLCTGTGGLAIAYARASGPDRWVIGLDFCDPMIVRGLAQVERKKLSGQVHLGVGDALRAPLPSGIAAVVCVAFGIRNTDSIVAAVREMTRLAAPGGLVAILEFSRPEGRLFAPAYLFYFRRILPRLGRWISGAAVDAYRYLPESAMAFPEPREILGQMAAAGLTDCKRQRMSFGAVSLYVGTRPTSSKGQDAKR